MKKYIVMAAAAMIAAGASANITFNLWQTGAEDHTGSLISDNSMFKIIVDVDGDGLDAISGSQSLTDFAVGDDQVAFTYSFDSAYPGEVYMWEGFTNIQRPDVATGNPQFYAVWYEGLTDTSATQMADGQWLGYTTDTSWLFPEDGATVSFGDGSTSVNTLSGGVNFAQAQAIPEPATFALMGIAGLGAFFNRKRLLNK